MTILERENRIPEHIVEALRKKGVDPAKLLFGVLLDMTPDGGRRDVYLSFSADTIYALSGEERVAGVRGARRLQASFETESLESIPSAGIVSMQVERMLSTSRLIGETEGGERLLALASIGLTKRLEDFAAAWKAAREGRRIEIRYEAYEETHCPKCGSPYPEQGRKVCPNCASRISVTLRLFGFFRDYKKKVAAILAVMILSTVFSIVSPYVGTKLLFDDVLAENGRFYGMVLAVVLVIFAVRFLGTLLNMLYSYVLASVVPWIVYDIKMKIFTAMQRLSTGFYTSKQTGSLMTRVNRDSNNIYWFFVDGLPYVIVNVLTFAGVITLMLVMSWRLALVTIVIIPVVVFIFRMMWRVFRGMHHKLWIYDSNLTSMVSDTLNGQRVIKAFAKEDEEIGRFDGHSGQLAGAEARLNQTEFTTFPLVYLLMFLGQVVITAIGAMMVLRGEMSLGTLLTFIAYLSMLYGPLEFMSWVSNWWSRCVDSAQRVFEIIDAQPDVLEAENPVQKAQIDGDIEFEHVYFEYEPARPVIRDMSLHVRAGEMLGIVGRAGAGKSTMANLMARLYDPKEGVVRIDGVDIRLLPTKLVRDNIGIVSQEIYLFIGSIADNIRYAQPDAPMEEVVAAAKAAGAHEFIMKLPDAYETRVGAGGQDLSGGERQRLSIARTIIQNPKVLILDEATAAMDTETERKIQESINSLKKGRTTVAIAHRLSTLKDADYLAVIEDGRVTEYGTHEELIRKKGEYRKLYDIQIEALKYTGFVG